MDATIEAPIMSLAEAEKQIGTWKQSLQDAQSALATHEQNLGSIALATSVEDATQALMRLQVEVKMAETGLAGAISQNAAVRRAERVAYAIQLRADVIEFNRLAEEASLVYNEFAPKAAAAWRRVEDYSRRSSLAELSAGDVESKLKQAAQS